MLLDASYDIEEDKILIPIDVTKMLLEDYIKNNTDELSESCKDFMEFIESLS